MAKKLAMFVMVLALACLAPCSMAFAVTEDTAGNAISTDNGGGQSVSSDFVWAGQSLDMSGKTVGGDLLAIGEDVNVTSSEIARNLRAAANNFSVNSTYVGGNVSVAGNSVQVGTGSNVIGGTYLFGNTVGFYGTTNALTIAGSDVTVDGVVNGDATVSGENVTIGPNAVITGHLNIECSGSPSVSPVSQVGSLDVTTSDNGEGYSILQGITGFSLVMIPVFFLIGYILLALLISWLMPREVDNGAAEFKNRPVILLLAGLATVLVLPAVAFVLILPIATIPISLSLLFIAGLLSTISMSFAGASIGRLVFKKMNPYGSAVLFTLILAAVSLIPFAGIIVYIFVALYTAGYFVLACGKRIKANKAYRSNGAGPQGGYGAGSQNGYGQNGYDGNQYNGTDGYYRSGGAGYGPQDPFANDDSQGPQDPFSDGR